MTDTLSSLQALASEFPSATDAAWRTLVDKALKGADFRKRLVSHTVDGIEIEPLYTRPSNEQHSEPNAAPDAIQGERPGSAPFTRANTIRLDARRWAIAQIRPEATPQALTTALQADIAGGAEALTIQLAAPGQSGLALKDLDAVIANLPTNANITLTIAPGAITPADAAALAKSVASPRHGLTIASLGLDPIGSLATTGLATFMGGPKSVFLAPVPWLEGSPKTLLADARPYHEAGASQAQEIACLAATLVAYLRAAEAAGKPPARALPTIGIAMATDADLFLGIAKLRAARRVIYRITDACGAGDAAARMPLAVTTSARMMTRRDPWVNMLRVTAAATSAAIGGADAITVLPYTWRLGAPDALSSRIARNVGLVLREEAGLARITDPAGGAWALEHLTADLALKAWAIFQEIEAAGGILSALLSGMLQDQIAAVSRARQADVATRRIELTGVSAFPDLSSDDIEVTPWPPLPPVPGSPAVRTLTPVNVAAAFEALRDRADTLPHPPVVFLATLGPLAEHNARAIWVANLLACAGIATRQAGEITASAEAGRLFADSQATTAVICGSDSAYAELAEATVMALKTAGANHVWLAGRSGSSGATLQAAGLDGYLHAGADAVATLTQVLDALTMP